MLKILDRAGELMTESGFHQRVQIVLRKIDIHCSPYKTKTALQNFNKNRTESARPIR